MSGIQVFTIFNKLPIAGAAFEHAVQSALREVGGRIYDTAHDLVPVDTGALRDSLFVEQEGDTVVVGARANYAVYVEMGTRKMSAQPFLLPAFDRHKGEVDALVATAARGAL